MVLKDVHTGGKRSLNIIIVPVRLVVTYEGEPSRTVILEGPTGGTQGTGPVLITQVPAF